MAQVEKGAHLGDLMQRVDEVVCAHSAMQTITKGAIVVSTLRGGHRGGNDSY